MKKGMIFSAVLTVAAIFGSKQTVAQNLFDDVKYWVGSGSDSALLVVDFLDNTWDSCYVWGVRFNGSTTGENMLNDVTSSDVNFTANMGGGFLNDIFYGSHLGESGSPNYWGTWSGTTIGNLASNSGIGETVNNGDIFGCSYTDFSPAVAPGMPISAFDSAAYTFHDPVFWIGTGNDSAILVVDFLDGTEMASYAWGFAFDGTTTGEDMLLTVSNADPMLDVAMSGGFLNDIDYDTHSGVGGNPNYWGTWSATNLGNWDMNMGISTTVNDGDFFGCSYTDFSPAVRPGYPQSSSEAATVKNNEANLISLYPNPAFNTISIRGENISDLKITDVQGRSVTEISKVGPVHQIDCSSWKTGTYLIQITGKQKTSVYKIVKH